MARDPELKHRDVDFPGIHMIQRHQIYLREAIEAITVTLDATTDHQKRLNEASTSISRSHDAIQAEFRYRKVLIKSTDLRLHSMEKSTQKKINLVCLLAPSPSIHPRRPSNLNPFIGLQNRFDAHKRGQRIDEKDRDSHSEFSPLYGCSSEPSLLCLYIYFQLMLTHSDLL